jgi:hypothetical protein
VVSTTLTFAVLPVIIWTSYRIAGVTV